MVVVDVNNPVVLVAFDVCRSDADVDELPLAVVRAALRATVQNA